MSFRSRTRSTQPIMPRRRSLSNSRVPSNSSYAPSMYYNGNSNYNTRPLSTGYYTGNQLSSSPIYQSPYTNHYGSRENLYNSSRSGHYPNGAYDKRFGGLSSYGSDRYISPYSSYDNGITTAGLNLGLGKSYPTKTNSYTNSNSNSKKRDYTPVRNTNLISTKPLSNSNSSLNSYSLNTPTKVSIGTNTPAAIVNRSQSLREQERKSRSRTRNRSAAVRSLSASSEKSEGYESGSERTSRSRLGSTSSSGTVATEKNDTKIGDSSENGEIIDYKALWEAAKLENDKLKELLKKKDEEISTAKAAVERFTNATTKNSLSELEKRERRAMERKLSEMEEELKLLQKYKTENERLRAENRALTRVVSKLTTSAQNQLHKKQ